MSGRIPIAAGGERCNKEAVVGKIEEEVRSSCIYTAPSNMFDDLIPCTEIFKWHIGWVWFLIQQL